MKTATTLLMLLVLFLPSCGKQLSVQEYTQWNLPDGAVARLDKGSVQKILYSPDGSRLAIQSTIGIWLYDTTTYRVERDRNEEIALLATHIGRTISVAFSPDGKTLAGVIRHGTVRLWDTEAGELKGTPTLIKKGGYGVMFSPDGKTLAGAIGDATVRLWDIETREQKRTLTGHTRVVTSVSFSPDGRTVAGGSEDKTVRLWDAVTGKQKAALTGHTEWIESVAFSPDGRTGTSCGGFRDKTVRLWDVKTGELKQILTRHIEMPYSVAFSPDGKTLAGGRLDGTILLWKVH